MKKSTTETTDRAAWPVPGVLSLGIRLRACSLCAAFALLIIAPGCNRPSKQMHELAVKSLGHLDPAAASMKRDYQRIKNLKDINVVKHSPAISILREPAEAIRIFDVRMKDYRYTMKGRKLSKADKKAEAQLMEARAAFANCAMLLNLKVKDKLPGYYIWEMEPPTAEFIISRTAKALEMEPNAKPPEDSCETYEKLSAELKKELRIGPAGKSGK